MWCGPHGSALFVAIAGQPGQGRQSGRGSPDRLIEVEANDTATLANIATFGVKAGDGPRFSPKVPIGRPDDVGQGRRQGPDPLGIDLSDQGRFVWVVHFPR